MIKSKAIYDAYLSSFIIRIISTKKFNQNKVFFYLYIFVNMIIICVQKRHIFRFLINLDDDRAISIQHDVILFKLQREEFMQISKSNRSLLSARSTSAS